jgi:hypothetical protein
MSLHEGQYVTLTFVVRTPSGERPGDDPRTLLTDDEVMFWGHEDGITDKAIELGADVSSWHEGSSTYAKAYRSAYERTAQENATQPDLVRDALARAAGERAGQAAVHIEESRG